MGQLCEIAEVFYKLDNMTVHILESRNDNPDGSIDEQTNTLSDVKAVVVKYRLNFDNRDYVSRKTHSLNERFKNNPRSERKKIHIGFTHA